MSSIGELATFYPVSGSFSSYATRFVDPSLGFTMGWLYYIMWALVSSVDVMVAQTFYIIGIYLNSLVHLLGV